MIARFLLICLSAVLCSGCLHSPPPHAAAELPQATETGFDDFSPPAVQALPPVEAEPQSGFTGALIHTDPANCTPCRALDADLAWLAKNYPEWTVGSLSAGEFDWSTTTPDGHRVPTIRFFKNGREVDRHQGYSTADWDTRRELLAKLVLRHPANAAK